MELLLTFFVLEYIDMFSVYTEAAPALNSSLLLPPLQHVLTPRAPHALPLLRDGVGPHFQRLGVPQVEILP